MIYEVRSSEKLRKVASETETKALLYLMNFRPDSDDIYYFIVDFFNDLTGMDNMGTCLWDVQSKGARQSSPKAIGKELITLFKNFVSEINFKSYILFVGGVSRTFRKDSSLTVFGIENVKADAVTLLKEGLIEEGRRKTYINNDFLTSENIDCFLNVVLFVIDDKEPKDYIKAIIKQHPKIIPEDGVLNAIFNEIRDKQANKKNVGNVEGVVIETTEEAINYCRHLTSSEIKLMVLHRIITRNPLGKGVPIPFLDIYNTLPPERQRETIEECQAALCRALFNRSTADGFWSLFECVYNLITGNPNKTTDQIFRDLRRFPDCMLACPDFDIISLKYFISIVKDGIEYEN